MDLRKAVYYMVLSTLAFTGMNILIKYLTIYSAYQLVLFRSLGTLVFTFGILFYKRIPILGNNRPLLVFRGIVGVTSMLLFFMAIKYMSIGAASALRYVSPIFAGIFAVILLKESMRPIQWLFFIFAFAGVLVLKGFDDDASTIGLLLGLASSVFSGLVYILIRKIGNTEHPIVIINYFMCVSAVVGGGFSIFYWTTPHGIDILLLLGLGVFGYVGQLFMTKAFQLGEASIIAPLKYVEVVFSIVAGVGLLGETYTFYSFVGMLMIIGGVVINILYKQKLNYRNLALK